MIGFSAPLWLAALAAIPLLRWLHRWRAPLRSAPVSAAFLWNSAEDISAGGQRRAEPDPAWRRRALILALLAAALADPSWQQETGLVTVWIDDSLSMSTVEAGEPRLQAGLTELAGYLDETRSTRAVLRSLTNPARSLAGDDPRAFDAGSWLLDTDNDMDPPAAALLDMDSAHWLVTDGADRSLREWGADAPLARVINVGTVTENVALTQLAVRRSLQQIEAFDVLVAVANAGAEDARGTLQLRAGSNELRSFDLTLAGGEVRYITAVDLKIESQLIASLLPGDATTADDALALEAPVFAKTPTRLDPTCPRALQAAVMAHPGLRATAGGEPVDLQVLCSQRAEAPGPVLRFHNSLPVPAEAAVEWQPGIGRLEELNLPASWIAVSEWDLALDFPYDALLVTEDRPLIIRRAGSPSVIESVIDMSHVELIAQPEYTALVGGLIELALNRPLLDAVSASSRNPEGSAIAPSRMSAAQVLAPTFGVVRRSLSDLLLLIAAFVLLVDLVLIWRASRAARYA